MDNAPGSSPIGAAGKTKGNGRYQITEKVGGGSHALVWVAKHVETGEAVAIKEVVVRSIGFEVTLAKPLDNFPAELAKRTLREVKILHHFKDTFADNPNIISLKNVFRDQDDYGQHSVCLVMDLMKCDLHQLIVSSVTLSQNHFILFVYQIFRALKAIHSANIIHRDLKPSNILINEQLLLKLCDFGTGRGQQTGSQSLRQTILRDVATTYYRAPEGILDQNYSKSVDVWAVGCIFAEMILRRPLFMVEETDSPPESTTISADENRSRGGNRGASAKTENKELIMAMMKVLGTPPASLWSIFPNSKLKDQLSKTEFPKRSIEEILPEAKELLPDTWVQALDLFQKMMRFDPKERITAEKALEHPFFAQLHDPTDEPEAPEFDDPDKEDPKGGLRAQKKTNWHRLLRKEVKNWTAAK